MKPRAWRAVRGVRQPFGVLVVAGLLVISRGRHHRAARCSGSRPRLLNRSAVNLITRGLGDDLAHVRGDVLTLAQPLVVEQVLAARTAVRARASSTCSWHCATRRSDYAQVRLIDALGHEVARVNTRRGAWPRCPPSRLQDKRDRRTSRRSMRLQPDQVYVSAGPQCRARA